MTIREALRELELWGAVATFNLTEYTDSNKCRLLLIKDWKDIVNQVHIQMNSMLLTGLSLSDPFTNYLTTPLSDIYGQVSRPTDMLSFIKHL